MPTTTIACPACATHLTVPAEAAGRTGRCPFCKSQFVVPQRPASGGDIDEDTITDWLSAEDEPDEDEDQPIGGRLGETLREKGEPEVEPPSTAAPEEAQAPPRHERPGLGEPQPTEASGRIPPSHDAEGPARAHEPEAPPRPPHPPRHQASAEPPESTEAASEAEPPPPQAKPAHPRDEDHATEREADGHSARSSSAEGKRRPEHDVTDEGKSGSDAPRKKHRYVVESAVRPQPVDERERAIEQQALHEQTMERRQRAESHQERPCDHEHLSLLLVEPTAVMLGFEARLLLRAPFRASIPIRCAGCGETDRKGMIARPLAWLDRGHGGRLSTGELESHYELDVHSGDTAAQVVDRMPIMDELISPFNRPMPYYLCPRCATHGTVTCQTLDSPRGALCEATVYHTGVALEWLGRVNGICGEEYLRLHERVTELDSDTWRQLGDQVRRRLAVWFQPESGEQLLAYHNDGDFPKKDAGLAGVVLTDRRLIFCKYHRHGKIRFADGEVNLLALRNGPFYDLMRRRQDKPQKLIRLRSGDLDALAAEIENIDAPIHLERDDT